MAKKSFFQTTQKFNKTYYDNLSNKSDSNKLKNTQQRIVKQDYFVKDFYYETNWGETNFDRILILSQIQASKIRFIPIVRITEAWQKQVESLQATVDYNLTITTKIIRQDFEDNEHHINKYQVYCDVTSNPSFTSNSVTYHPDYEIKIIVVILNDQFYHELKKQKE